MSDINKKILLVFDFDNTITDSTSTYIIRKEFLTYEEYEENRIAHETGNDWIKYTNDYLKLFKKHGVTLEKINKVLQTVNLADGMKNLFDFIRQNKSKYDVILLTSTFNYVIEYLLKLHKIFDLFTEIFCVKSEIGKPEDDQIIYVYERKKHNCKDCGPCGCKNFDYNEYCENHDMNQYLKTIFICDGKNDFCLAKTLKKNDVIFERKNYDLYQKLLDKSYRYEISGELIDWASGNDIIKYLKNN
jgi:pyridoxal phosphate phosphatase PHOSPHO2